MKNEAIEKTYKAPSKPPKYSSWATIINQITKDDERILDVGCASGYLGKMIKRRNKNVEIWGIDGNPEAIKKAKKIYNKAYTVNLNDKLDSKMFPGTFDVIIFADVLEHVLFPEEVLKFFAKKLKKGGRIIISLPNVASWRVRLSLLLGSFNYQDYGVLDRTHLHLYTFHSAKKLAENAGLNVTKVSPTANLPLIGVLTSIPFFKRLLSIQVVVNATNYQNDNK